MTRGFHVATCARLSVDHRTSVYCSRRCLVALMFVRFRHNDHVHNSNVIFGLKCTLNLLMIRNIIISHIHLMYYFF